jgi:hypothetical protein
MIGPDSDTAVLALLREEGPCTLTVRQIAAKAGVHRVTARVSVAALAMDGLVCVIPNYDESAYSVRHVHAAPGPCEHSLGCLISEEPAP